MGNRRRMRLVKMCASKPRVLFKDIGYLEAFEYAGNIYIKSEDTLAGQMSLNGALPPRRFDPHDTCFPLYSRIVVSDDPKLLEDLDDGTENLRVP